MIGQTVMCVCSNCRESGYVIDEFTSPYTGLCAKCEKERKMDSVTTPTPDTDTMDFKLELLIQKYGLHAVFSALVVMIEKRYPERTSTEEDMIRAARAWRKI